MQVSLKKWVASGSPWVWLNAGAVAISVVLVLGLLGVIASRGLVHFWPSSLQEYQFADSHGSQMAVLGERVQREQVTAEQIRNAGLEVPEGVQILDRQLIKVGNRDMYGSDFRWVLERQLSDLNYPEHAVAIERREWGNFYGYIVGVKEEGQVVAQQSETDNQLWSEVLDRTERATSIYKNIQRLESGTIGAVNYALEKLRLAERSLVLDGLDTPQNLAELQAEKVILEAEYARLETELMALYTPFKRDALMMVTADGQHKEINFSDIVRLYQPNSLSLWQKMQHYGMKLVEFVSDDPREANTEGGIFPAIFGTVLMVMIMSLIVTPFGVIAAVYLREYASQGFITRTIRIAVNNLAGVPSIVYGVFGLGFFVYFIGGNLDQLFYAPALPSPTFGTPGLLWASLTLALLTLPVVIVATEEGLSRIPRSVREGSLALGATKFETLMRVVIPMASPAMMTGVILAVARAAGEVAPLMLVGVVKLAPNLPLDMNAPFLHLERKFMHLGFHIYDVGFQSPNVEAARPLVYATALMLVVVIAVLNLTAIAIRNRLREKYRALDM
ncbi:MAG: phosphate ABC transporter permease PstA [Gammaproteobacteria bacterium]|jgi:phosphate transport system permease protein|nr:phosphate ABC transporter permease PstA [Pseudomonas sp.]MDY0413969.1 phosphate ABC transporter permease PstA [Pseudomonas sp.]NLO53130.1 phosphate ABC transporter permease PstA [Gammaproteobacteria bacterium]